MKLSLSKREKVLIVGSLIAIILFVYLSLIRPGLDDKVENQKNRQANLEVQLISMENAAVRLAKLEDEIQLMEAYMAAELPTYFGTEMKQENVLLLVRDLLEASKIDAFEMYLDEEGSSRLRDGLEKYYNQKQLEAGQGKEASQGENDPFKPESTERPVEGADPVESWIAPPVRMISVSIRFRSAYPDMMNFIDSISNHSKKIGIESLTLDGGGQDPDKPLEGTIRIFLPALEIVESSDPTPLPEDLQNDPEPGRQNENPFYHGDRYIEPEEVEPLPQESQEPGEDDQP